MNTRINVKLLIGLLVGLTLFVGAGAVVAYQVLTKSGAEYARMGDEAVAAEDWETARQMYGRAVGHDRTNVEWLSKWRTAIIRDVPEDQLTLERLYRERYMGILERLAAIQQDDPQAQRDYLDMLYEQAKAFSPRPSTWLSLRDLATDKVDQLASTEPEVQALRRYEGLAGLRLMQLLPDDEENAQETLNDLRAAYEADPTDVETKSAIVTWHVIEWRRAVRERRPEAAAVRADEVRDELASLLEAHPDDPNARLVEIAVSADLEVLSQSSVQARREAMQRLRGIEERAVEAFYNADPEDLDATDLRRLSRAISIIRGESAAQVSLELANRLLEVDPDNAQVMTFKGDQLGELGRHEEAIETYQRIVELPPAPVSLNALILEYLRNNAVYEQARNELALVSRADRGTETWSAALARAKQKREELAARVAGGSEAPTVRMVDARIALAENRLRVAEAQLKRLDDELSNTDELKAEALAALAATLKEQGSVGVARDTLERLLEMEPTNLRARVSLAEVLLLLNDPSRALLQVEQLREIMPADPRLESMEAMIRRQLGEDVGEIRDPVTAGILRAEDRLNETPPNIAAAQREIESLSESHPNDPRVQMARIRMAERSGRMEEMKRLVRESAQKFPENQRFQELASLLEAQEIMRGEQGDPLDALLAQIEASDAPPAVKAVRRYALLVRANQFDRARAALEEAVSLDPEGPEVVEARFGEALRQSEMGEARQIANLATRLNLDSAEGLTYDARLQLARGELASAMTTLESAVERLPFNARVWRVLGETQLSQGHVRRGLESLRRGYDINPRDTEIGLAYAQALLRVGRPTEALEVIRAARAFAPGDAVAYEVWLGLEGEYGDREAAIAERRRLREDGVGGRPNLLALARLLIAEQEYEPAGALIEEARQEKDDLESVMLAAQWHAAQDQVESGASVIESHIASIPEDEMTPTPLLALGQYLIRNGQEEPGVAAFERARSLQREDVRSADRALGEHYFTKGDYENAVEPYERIIQGGADTANHFFAMRAAEAYARLGRWADAERMIGRLGPDASKDIRALMIRAEIARGQGSRDRMEDLLNQAVAAAPNDPRPFMQRASFHMNEPALFRDVLDDLEQAIALQPGNLTARKMRVAVFLRQDQFNNAIAELRQGVEQNPDSVEFRVALVRQLVDMGRMEEAYSTAEGFIEERPDESIWRNLAGDIYAEQKRWDDAAKHYNAAYEMDPSAPVAIALAETLVFKTDPDPRRSLELYEEHKDKVQDNGATQALRALAAHLAGATDAAKRIAREALTLVDNDSELSDWFVYVQDIFRSASAEDTIRGFVEFLRSQEPPSAVSTLYEVKTLRFEASISADHSAIIERLRALRSETDDKQTLTELYTLLSTLLYSRREYGEAAEALRAGLEVSPDNLEFNNNLAFTLAKHLNDPDAALEPARRGVQLAPPAQKSSTLDTLGWVYLKLGQFEQAQSTLDRAVDLAAEAARRASNRAEQVQAARMAAPSNLHMAQLLLERGDPAAARRHAETAQLALRADPTLEVEYGEELEQVMERLERAE